MSDRLRVFIVIASGVIAWLVLDQPAEPPPVPKPAPSPAPQPAPAPRPCPKPWDAGAAGPVGPHERNTQAHVGGATDADGTQIQCDLPGSEHMKNAVGSDGSGLCVFTSIAHSARWQNVPLLTDFRDWMKSRPGGGYPSKVDKMIARIAKEKSAVAPDYVQVEGTDLEVLKLACRTGRMPSVTYSRSPTGRYGGQRIAHMVNLVHADDRHFVVLDNNYPGEDRYEWLSAEEFLKTYASGGGGWAVILLSPGPPPAPRNEIAN